jgi:hypothetical protein
MAPLMLPCTQTAGLRYSVHLAVPFAHCAWLCQGVPFHVVAPDVMMLRGSGVEWCLSPALALQRLELLRARAGLDPIRPGPPR